MRHYFLGTIAIGLAVWAAGVFAEEPGQADDPMPPDASRIEALLNEIEAREAAEAETEATEAAPDDRPAPPELAASLVEANNSFACDLYQQLRKSNDGNIFYSPASISIAMSMTAAGAEGQTESEMFGALRMKGDETRLHAQYADLLAHWNQKADNRPYQLRVANRIWVMRGFDVNKGFVDLTRTKYAAPLAETDFAKSEAARGEINGWVEEQTNDRIQDLIPGGVLDAQTRMVLVNAIYFKGKWADEFKEENTQPAPFFTAAGKEVQVPLMHQQSEFAYFENEQLQAISLPYQGDALSMVVLLPRERDGLAKLEENLTPDNLAKWTPKRKTEVMTWLPKFKVETSFQLNEVLQALGMKRAFTPQADFSGIATQEDLYISAVLHKAFVEVNEEGTEAAAATAVVVRALMAVEPQPPKVFRADHPFIYLIRDNTSGSILFVGRMADPS